MTYPYGTKGAPVVGNGLGGLPRRAEAARGDDVVASVNINAASSISTTTYYNLPFLVDDPSKLTIRWQANAAVEAGGFYGVGQLIPTPTGGGRIHQILNTADRARDNRIEYDFVNNRIVTVSGTNKGVNGAIYVTLHDRKVLNFLSFADPGSNAESLLPLTLSDPKKVYLGCSSNAATYTGFIDRYISSSDTNSWHLAAYDSNAKLIKISSPSTFMRGSNAISSSYYLLEFA